MKTAMKLVILDPGHFHAALLQKTMYANVDATVHVYAEEGPDLRDYLRKIESYNARPVDPTSWRMQVHASPDYLARFSADRAGNVAVIAGNNRRKTEYLTRAIGAGMNVLADKPMAIDSAGFDALRDGFSLAGEKGVLLYDIMTERHEITTMLQKAFSRIPAVFGTFTIFPSSFPVRPSSGRPGFSTCASRVRASSTSRRIWSTSCNGSASPARSWNSRGIFAS